MMEEIDWTLSLDEVWEKVLKLEADNEMLKFLVADRTSSLQNWFPVGEERDELRKIVIQQANTIRSLEDRMKETKNDDERKRTI